MGHILHQLHRPIRHFEPGRHASPLVAAHWPPNAVSTSAALDTVPAHGGLWGCSGCCTPKSDRRAHGHATVCMSRGWGEGLLCMCACGALTWQLPATLSGRTTAVRPNVFTVVVWCCSCLFRCPHSCSPSTAHGNILVFCCYWDTSGRHLFFLEPSGYLLSLPGLL